MTSHTDRRFELSGLYRGTIRNIRGKRRVAFQVGAQTLELKIAKRLRRHLEPLGPGSTLKVAGHELPNRPGSELQYKVDHLIVLNALPLPDSACRDCPIQICVKKNCWNRGGRQLWATMKSQLAQSGLAGEVAMEPVRCLGRCKRAPNMDFGPYRYDRCGQEQTAEVVRKLLSLRAKA